MEEKFWEDTFKYFQIQPNESSDDIQQSKINAKEEKQRITGIVYRGRFAREAIGV